MSKNSPSIVEYFAEHEKYKCGYCKRPDTNFSHGMWAHTLTVQDYQDLIDRGWRRSGKYCYKPTMDQTCCPMYTIKCEALDFKISKSQKKVLKKMSKFLNGELKRHDAADCDESIHEGGDFNPMEIPNAMEQAEKVQRNVTDINISLINDKYQTRILSPQNAIKCQDQTGDNSSVGAVKNNRNLTPTSSTSKDYKTGTGLDKSKPPPKKAKFMRLERKQSKLLSMGKSSTEINSMLKHGKAFTVGKTLEDLFSEENTGQNKLEPRLVRTSPMSSEYSNTSKESYELYKKYQMAIHRDPAEKLTEDQYAKFLVKSPLQIKLLRVGSEEFLDSFDLVAKLYEKYQMTIHKDPPDECDKESFTNFLAKSPLQHWRPANGPPQGYGSFHQQYWLNDKLIAVGVIDILPSCVSSVYFFYDPIYSYLSLGTYGSLREVMLTRQLNKVAPNLKYYYMGFYIHTCPKMRYKARMCPSKLLCPETYVWCSIENCLPKLDKEKYSRFNEDLDAVDENISNDISQVIIKLQYDLGKDCDSLFYVLHCKVLILHKHTSMPYYIYKMQAHRAADEDEIREYASLVGIRCARNLLLYRN